MSATEVIEQIKSLSPGEQAQVVDFIHKLPKQSAEKEPAVRYADDAAFEAATEKVFQQHADLLRKLAQ